MSQSEAVIALKSTMVLANKILVYHKVVDGFGHISARHPEYPERFLLAKRVAPGLVVENDIIEFDLKAEPITEKDAPTFLERFIHSEVYTKREDVQSVVHSHSPMMVAMGAVGKGVFQPICHTCGFLGGGTPLFEIRDTAGDETNLLITNRNLGKALADSLAQSNVVLMRGHGSTTVGESVQQAVYRAVYSEINARIQLSAQALGTPTFLTSGEAEAAEETAQLQVERTWSYWVDLVS